MTVTQTKVGRMLTLILFPGKMNSVMMGDDYQNEQKAKITQIYHAELYLTLCDIPIVVVPQNCMSVIII